MPPSAMDAMPDGGQTIRCSAETAPISPASSLPPMASISSAWILGRSPYCLPVSRMRRDSSAEKNALFAEHIAEFRNSLLPYCRKHFLAQKLQIALPVVPVGFRYGVRAHKGRSEIHHMMFFAAFRSRAALLHSSRSTGRSRSWPLRSSCRSEAFHPARRRLFASSCSSLADCVARMVDRMPPPAARMSR